MKYLSTFLLIFTLIACSENTEEQSATFLGCNELSESYKMYNGEKIKCQFHYTLTEYNNQQFIELNTHCADLARVFVINENCEDICETLPYDISSECGKYLNGRKIIEILLIEKE